MSFWLVFKNISDFNLFVFQNIHQNTLPLAKKILFIIYFYFTKMLTLRSIATAISYAVFPYSFVMFRSAPFSTKH